MVDYSRKNLFDSVGYDLRFELVLTKILISSFSSTFNLYLFHSRAIWLHRRESDTQRILSSLLPPTAIGIKYLFCTPLDMTCSNLLKLISFITYFNYITISLFTEKQNRKEKCVWASE